MQYPPLRSNSHQLYSSLLRKRPAWAGHSGDALMALATREAVPSSSVAEESLNNGGGQEVALSGFCIAAIRGRVSRGTDHNSQRHDRKCHRGILI